MKRGGWSPPKEMVSVMTMGRVLMWSALYSPRYTRHVANELFETLTQFYREILEPEFDRLCAGTEGMATKSDMREFFDKIHARFDRLERIMKGETSI